MAGSLNTKSYLKEYKARSKWHRVLTCMAAVVVFCTTYALVLPALTLERPVSCGMEEHVHTVACYADSGSALLCQEAIALHEHDESCFDESGAVICGYSDTGLHQHDDSCYNEEQELICGYADFVLHTHDDTCYNTDGTLRCPLPEIEYYTVKQPKESGLLDGILGELMHDSTTGSALDYTADEEPAAEDGAEADIEYEEIQITVPHTHDDSCFELEDGSVSDVPVCGLLEVQVHTHTAACMADEPLICELEEHQHSEVCYKAEEPVSDETSDDHAFADLEEESPEEDIVSETLSMELEQYITSVTLQYKLTSEDDWAEVANNTVDKNGQLRFLLHYTLPAGLLSAENSTLTWQLPETLLCAARAETIYDAQNEAVGQYVLHENGSVTLAFSDAYIEASQAGNSITGAFKLDASVADLITQENCVTISFTENIAITLIIVEMQDRQLTAAIYTDETYQTPVEDGTVITVSGSLPVNAQVKAYPVAVELPEQTVLCAYDIAVYTADGALFEPAPGQSLQVNIQSSQLALEENEKTAAVYYVPENGQAEDVESTVTDGSATFAAPHFSVYAVATRNGKLAEGKYGEYTFKYNREKNAFTNNPEYAKYYNANSPLGVAGSFHIVAFDTATLGSHTNGNILAKNLYAASNFGTNDYPNELSYIQRYMQVNSSSASKNEHLLILGSDTELVSSGGRLAVRVKNGDWQTDNYIDRPLYLLQDENTATTPFIDLEQVQQEIKGLSMKFDNMEKRDSLTEEEREWGYGTNIQFYHTDRQQNDFSITLEGNSSVGVYHIKADKLNLLGNGSKSIKMKGLETRENKTIIMNVDCSDIKIGEMIKMPSAQIWDQTLNNGNGAYVQLREVTNFSDGKIIWNFLNVDGKKIELQNMAGMIIAPGADLTLSASLNGTVVAENVTIKAESHRMDFTGEIVPPIKDVVPACLRIMKVDSKNVSTVLEGTVFELYKWDGTQYVKCDIEAAKLTTDANGMINIDKLAFNTAYMLKEVSAPEGYELDDKLRYFYFANDNKETYPECKPENFTGESIKSESIQRIKNEKGTTTPDYTLPEAGGGGVQWYTLTGLLLMGTALGLYRRQKTSRKGEL